LNYCLVYIVPTCAQISFASFNGVEQFFYWLQKQVENYALHIDTTTNESLRWPKPCYSPCTQISLS